MREIYINAKHFKLADNTDILEQILNPFKAKLGGSGDLEYSDFSRASMEEYHDFRSGIGLASDLPSESNRISWSEGVDVSTPRSAVLGPLITTAGSFGVAPVRIIDFQSVTYAIGDNIFGKWNTTDSRWDIADPYLIHDCEAAWDELVDGDATVTLDTTIERQGSGCAKMVIGAGLGNGDIIATDNITSLDLSSAEKVRFWAYSTDARASGDLQLLLDDTASCASPVETIDFPALTAATWTLCTLTLANPGSDTAIISVGVKFTNNAEASTIYVDHIRGTFPDAIDALVIQDNTDEYFIVSSASAAMYCTDAGITWSTLTNAIGGYMTGFAGRLWFISTDGKTVQYSALNDIDNFDDQWVSPTGHEDPDSGWANETNAYDERTEDFSNDYRADSSAMGQGNYSDALYFTVASDYYDRIRFYVSIASKHASDKVDIDAYYGGQWNDVYDGTFTDKTWTTKTIGSFELINQIRLRMFNYDDSAGNHVGYIYEVDIGTAQQFELSGDFGTVYGLFEGKLLSDGSPALYFHSNRGLFSIDVNAEKAYQQEVEYPPLTNAGRAGKYWNANLWIATGYGILKIAPATAVHVGPDQDDGLPNGSQGTIYAMETVNNWLVYCVNGGSSDKSSILKRNATVGGNLQVYTGASNKPIACLLHSPSSLYTNGRLWWGEDTDVKYCMFPDVTHNVTAVSSYEYVAASTANHLQLPIFRKLAAIGKTALGVAAITKNLDSNEKLTVYYGLNGAAPTVSLGEFITSPRPTILTFNSGLGTEFYRIQFAVKFERGGTNTNTPELESLMFYYYPTTSVIRAWTFRIDATGKYGELDFTNMETIRDTNTLVAFYPSGDSSKTSYNVKLVSMPSREWWENQGRRDGIFDVRVEEVFEG